MPVKTVTGNIWDLPAKVRVNTVNCIGVSGKGIALEFKDRYGRMFIEYTKACRDGLLEPGGVLDWHSPDGTHIINVATKDHWKNPSRYEWIETGLRNIKKSLLVYPEPIVVALPAMGCSNGGLEFDVVQKMVYAELDAEAHDIHLYRLQA